MAKILIIGGSGSQLFPIKLNNNPPHETIYGTPSAALSAWADSTVDQVAFLPRHGVKINLAPHKVNYRANIQMAKDFCPDWVLSLNAVGAINSSLAPGTLVFPDQLIDYTWGRDQTFFDLPNNDLKFIDFTRPYSSKLRKLLRFSADALQLSYSSAATYGVTQGPRLETAAEIDRMDRDGCDLVGMTALPETALAREQNLEYASIAMVVNRAAGRGNTDIHADIKIYLDECVSQVIRLINHLIQQV
ncbi:MAG: S-methyl-5'-thioinosine phosphorylase [Pseudomonadota bacterium]|nr:S-methyl-5'-thioinosine phosphorylase [Pseudomonadota bacterium]